MKPRQILEFLAIVALLIWGGLFLLFYVSGRIERYVDVTFRTWALLAGLGLCVLALFNLATFRQKTASCCHSQGEEEGGTCCDHDHDQPASGLLTAVLVLLVPVLMAARVSEDRFSGSYIDKWGKIERQIFQMQIAQQREQRTTAARAAAEPDPAALGEADPAVGSGSAGGDEWGPFTLEDLKRMVPQNEAGNFLLDVPQIFYTAGDDELMRVMEGLPVETTAQVMEETSHNPEGNRLSLFRLFIECCAADARPLSIPIQFPQKPAPYEEMGWVVVTGKMHFSEENGEILPIILVDTMEPAAEPMDAMMY